MQQANLLLRRTGGVSHLSTGEGVGCKIFRQQVMYSNRNRGVA